MNKKTIIPDPEKHLSFYTKLMVLAIDLYQHEAPRDFCPYANFAHKKLKRHDSSIIQILRGACLQPILPT